VNIYPLKITSLKLTSILINLKILDAPIVTATSKAERARAKTQLKLSCSARANPAVTEYRWSRNGQTLQNFNEEELLINSLDVSSKHLFFEHPRG